MRTHGGGIRGHRGKSHYHIGTLLVPPGKFIHNGLQAHVIAGEILERKARSADESRRRGKEKKAELLKARRYIPKEGDKIV